MEQLKQYLADRGMTQEGFAQLINVHPSVVSKFLNNKATPSLATAFVIQRVTNGRVKASAWVKGVSQ